MPGIFVRVLGVSVGLHAVNLGRAAAPQSIESPPDDQGTGFESSRRGRGQGRRAHDERPFECPGRDLTECRKPHG